MFAELILPLPLYSTYTYSVPPEMERNLQVGSRVLVQFGRRKYYTAVVASLSDSFSGEYEVKPVMALLDAAPILRYPQLKLWQWVADYYLCSPGEVFRAAVPTGLKPESETTVSLSPDYDPDVTDSGEAAPSSLSERQAMVVMLLSEKKKLRVSEIEQTLHLSGAAAVVNSLLEKGVVEISENVVERYRPKKETFVRLRIPRHDNEALHKLFEAVTRSRRQEKALVAYLDLSRWMTPTAEVRDVTREALLKHSGATPGILKAMADKGIFDIYRKSVNRFKTSSNTDAHPMPQLSDVQKRALQEIHGAFREKEVVLLHGVTGSGKTEIYSHLIKEVLDRGDQVLYLVPEISLTTQLTDRLRRVFGDRLLVYHSKFSDNERVDIWRRMLESSEPLVILGARSAVFLPFARLGLVVVDEEHEASYKQYDPAPRYNARDVATVLARMHGARTLFGSATPSVETYWKASNGRYGLVTLSERFEGAGLPDVGIVDMRDQRKRKLAQGSLSMPLRLLTREALEGGRQAIMFQNRRGFAPVVVCRTCGWTPKCVNCDVSLVYHKNTAMLRCHYCGFSRPLPSLCPACGENSIEVYGYGTERIAEEMHRAFEGYRVARMDLDTTRNKDSYQELIEEFARHETDILVGTQMVSKGLDFEKVALVGVINADTLLNFPDFRSNERAFNMLEQVAGRAGRRKEKGTVIIQTTRPDDAVLQRVKAHDYLGFYHEELSQREQYSYPPFTRIINIYLRSKDAPVVDRAAVTFALALRNIFGNRVLGPEKPFVSRVASWYLQSIMLKVETTASMVKVKALLRELYAGLASNPDIRASQISYDVDPV
ncbi:MAG: primosomal protein N' [Muribaculaceae bacterium]|nr:primosomal protein N' [Muribaculaceae bacterium]